jgi:hypothetical protein
VTAGVSASNTSLHCTTTHPRLDTLCDARSHGNGSREGGRCGLTRSRGDELLGEGVQVVGKPLGLGSDVDVVVVCLREQESRSACARRRGAAREGERTTPAARADPAKNLVKKDIGVQRRSESKRTAEAEERTARLSALLPSTDISSSTRSIASPVGHGRSADSGF